MDLAKFNVSILSKGGKFYLEFAKSGKLLLLGERYWFENGYLWAQKGCETHLFLIKSGDRPVQRLVKMTYCHFLSDGDFIFRLVSSDVWMRFSHQNQKNYLLGTLFCHIQERNFWLFLKHGGGKKVKFISVLNDRVSSLEAYSWSWLDANTLILKTADGNIKLRIR